MLVQCDRDRCLNTSGNICRLFLTPGFWWHLQLVCLSAPPNKCYFIWNTYFNIYRNNVEITKKYKNFDVFFTSTSSTNIMNLLKSWQEFIFQFLVMSIIFKEILLKLCFVDVSRSRKTFTWNWGNTEQASA